MSSNKRLQVITYSILVERVVAQMLAKLLDIDLKDSKTLGNKSTAMSFRQKLDLLTDIKALDNHSVKKYQLFAEIRNQFAHNYDVQDFTSCFSFLNGAESYLRKNYENKQIKHLSLEDQLTEMYTKLFNDILDTCVGLQKQVQEKFLNIGIREGKEQAHNTFMTLIKKHSENDLIFKEKIQKIIVELDEALQGKLDPK